MHYKVEYANVSSASEDSLTLELHDGSRSKLTVDINKDKHRFRQMDKVVVVYSFNDSGSAQVSRICSISSVKHGEGVVDSSYCVRSFTSAGKCVFFLKENVFVQGARFDPKRHAPLQRDEIVNYEAVFMQDNKQHFQAVRILCAHSRPLSVSPSELPSSSNVQQSTDSNAFLKENRVPSGGSSTSSRDKSPSEMLQVASPQPKRIYDCEGIIYDYDQSRDHQLVWSKEHGRILCQKTEEIEMLKGGHWLYLSVQLRAGFESHLNAPTSLEAVRASPLRPPPIQIKYKEYDLDEFELIDCFGTVVTVSDRGAMAWNELIGRVSVDRDAQWTDIDLTHGQTIKFRAIPLKPGESGYALDVCWQAKEVQIVEETDDEDSSDDGSTNLNKTNSLNECVGEFVCQGIYGSRFLPEAAILQNDTLGEVVVTCDHYVSKCCATVHELVQELQTHKYYKLICVPLFEQWRSTADGPRRAIYVESQNKQMQSEEIESDSEFRSAVGSVREMDCLSTSSNYASLDSLPKERIAAFVDAKEPEVDCSLVRDRRGEEHRRWTEKMIQVLGHKSTDDGSISSSDDGERTQHQQFQDSDRWQSAEQLDADRGQWSQTSSVAGRSSPRTDRSGSPWAPAPIRAKQSSPSQSTESIDQNGIDPLQDDAVVDSLAFELFELIAFDQQLLNLCKIRLRKQLLNLLLRRLLSPRFGDGNTNDSDNNEMQMKSNRELMFDFISDREIAKAIGDKNQILLQNINVIYS